MPLLFGARRGGFIDVHNLIAADVLDGLMDTARPLNLNRLLQPPLEIPGHDLVVRGVPGLGGLETTSGLETRLVEGLAAPEQEADAIFELAVADNRILVHKPHRVPVPDLALSVR